MERVLEDLIRIRKSDFHCSVLLKRKFTWRCCNVQPKVIMETHSFLDVGSTNRTVLQRIQDIGDLFSTAVEGDWMRCQVDHTMPLHHAALFNWDTKSLCFLSVRKGRQKESHRVTRRQNDSMQKKKKWLGHYVHVERNVLSDSAANPESCSWWMANSTCRHAKNNTNNTFGITAVPHPHTFQK